MVHVHLLQRRIPWLLGAVLAIASAWATAQPIQVKVQKKGDTVVIDVEAQAAVEPAIAYAVLTDYERMPRYVSSLKWSRMSRTGPNTLEVEQVAQAQVAFWNFTVRSLRTVELVPLKEVRSHLIKGDFTSYEFTTRVEEKDGGTLITHHGEYVPKSWLPPMIGPAVIQGQTEKQYAEMIAEMLRRKSARTDAAAGIPPSQ
jgi:hypothetical protein